MRLVQRHPKHSAVVPADSLEMPDDGQLPPEGIVSLVTQAPAQDAVPQPRPHGDRVQRARSSKDKDHCSRLPAQVGQCIGKKTLVLDLDETLLHSCFRVIPDPDIVITVDLEGQEHNVYVRKRPGVDDFLRAVGQFYEVVIYTASVSKYADKVIDQLDKHRVVSYRLFREACTWFLDGFVKDLSRLGRPLQHVLTIDNSPICYALQPENAIAISTWRGDKNDCELYDLLPILHALSEVDDIPRVLSGIMNAADQEFDGENQS